MDITNSIFTKKASLKDNIRIICDNMISTRPKGELVYRPYKKNDVYSDMAILGLRKVDLKKLYPDAQVGNIVYVGTVLESVADYDVNLHVIGNVKVIFRDKIIHNYEDGDRHAGLMIHLNKGENFILFMVRCDSPDKFEFEFMPSVGKYWMWAKDYILNVRATIPIEHYKHEDGVGISKLYDIEDAFDKNFVYPTIDKQTNNVDFNKIYPEVDGVCAYALTFAMENTNLKLKFNSETKVFVNGIYMPIKNFNVNKGDTILVKSIKGKQWGIEFNEDAKIGIPFLSSSRKSGDKWITVGTFGTKNCINTKFGPELKLQFVRPYLTEKWKKTFWRLSENDYVRPYMDTCFFSQWFYALMVGHFGLLQAAKTLDRPDYLEYFIDSMQNMAEFYEYMQYDYKEFGQTTFIQRSVMLNNLDSIGSIGMNMCELYKLTSSKEALACIDILIDAAKNNIPRFEDGTYCRSKDMWADDMYMSCPFLVRAGLIKNNDDLFHEVVNQVMGFKKRLWMEDKKIFSHIFFLDTNLPNMVPWGRGNGWIFLTLSDILENIPKNISGRNLVMDLYRDFAEGIINTQDESGLWHQVLTRKDSYTETSCTGMFIIGLCRGVYHGWLDEKYKENILKAYDGLIKEKIDIEGNVYDVCKGSSNSKDEKYYIDLGVIDNDDHGTGIIISAMTEMLRIFDI